MNKPPQISSTVVRTSRLFVDHDTRKAVLDASKEVGKTLFKRKNGEGKTTVSAQLRHVGEDARAFFKSLSGNNLGDEVFGGGPASELRYVPAKLENASQQPAVQNAPAAAKPAGPPQTKVANVVKAVSAPITRDQLQAQVAVAATKHIKPPEVAVGRMRVFGIVRSMPMNLSSPEHQADAILQAVVDSLLKDELQPTAANVLNVFMETPLFSFFDEKVCAELIDKLAVISSDAHNTAVVKRDECVQQRKSLIDDLESTLSKALIWKPLDTKHERFNEAVEIAANIRSDSKEYGGKSRSKPTLDMVAVALEDHSAEEVKDICEHTPLFDLLDPDEAKLVIEHVANLKFPPDTNFEDTRPVVLQPTRRS